VSNYLTFRTYHKGQYGYCGLEYAKLYPQHLTPEALEQFMGRTPGTKNKPRTPAIASNLLEALNFISVAATKDIQPINTHVQLGEGFAIMYDGQITAGYPIEEELDCLPNYELFLKAIKKCGNSLALTQLDGDRLSVVGEKLKATIPCLDAGAASGTRPDPPVCVVDDRLKTAMAVCSVLASEQASRVLEASLLLKAYDCTGTNGASIIQFYHGFDLPPNLVVPCIFAKAVAKTKQPITAFGYSYNADMQKFTSITFYFEGGMWIKTQLYQDEWPDIARIIDVPFQSFELPSGLFEGIEAVSDFN
jgi:hypothetical protein